MKCSRCNKDGAKPYNYNDGGRKTVVYLCDACLFELENSHRHDPYGSSTDRRVSRTAENSGLLNMDRRCPSCGRALSAIRRTGYLGCANCFRAFRNELLTVIDKMQYFILSKPEKKQREMQIMLLEDEYARLLEEGTNGDYGSASRRLRDIEAQLEELGVRVDG